MASKRGSYGTVRLDSRKKRRGVHSKNKTSNHKSSKNYRKKYVGQGRP